MLNITIPAMELFDESTGEFITIKEQNLALEHSLVSLSKWEMKWNKPFLSKENKTTEETIDYIRCMTLTKNVDPVVYYGLTQEIVDKVNAYISAPMTATWFRDSKKGGSREIITNELIYYWMIALQIPFECQKWHLNRLLTLIRVCNAKNEPGKKMGKNAQMNQQRMLNEARRKAHNSTG